MSSSDDVAPSKIPDENIEGLMSSDIVNDDQIDLSTYIEGVSALEDDDDEEEEEDSVDETLEPSVLLKDAVDSLGNNSDIDLTLNACDRRGGTIEDCVGGAEASTDDADADGDQLSGLDRGGSHQEDDDDVDELSSIFNVSVEEMNETDDGNENVENDVVGSAENDVTEDGDENVENDVIGGAGNNDGEDGDVPVIDKNAPIDGAIDGFNKIRVAINDQVDENNFSVGRNSKRRRRSSNDRPDDNEDREDNDMGVGDIVGAVFKDVSLLEEDDSIPGPSNKKRRWKKSDGSSPPPPLPTSSPPPLPASSSPPPLPSSSPPLRPSPPPPPRLVPQFDDEDDNALHQFPSSFSKSSRDLRISNVESASNEDGPNCIRDDREDPRNSSEADRTKNHLPSETDENTPPSLWGISEVISRLQQQQRQDQEEEEDTFCGSVGIDVSRTDDEVFDDATTTMRPTLAQNSAAQNAVVAAGEADGDEENRDPSSSVCSADCTTKSNGNVLQALCENTNLKRKRDATSFASTSSPSCSAMAAKDQRRILESRCLTAWKDIKTEIKAKFNKWSPENPHFNDKTANHLANDTFDDAGLIAKDVQGVLKPPPERVVIAKPKEKRRRVEESPGGIFQRLSDELLLSIFQWVPKSTLARVMRVNRRFRRIGCDESLWHRFDLGDRTIKPGHLGIVLSRGVQSLRLTRSEVQGSSLFPPHAFNCGMSKAEFDSTESSFKVRHLDLSMIVADNKDVLAELLGLSKKVTHLSLERCSLPPSTLHLVAQMENLCVLNLSTCSDLGGDGHGLNDYAVVPILQRCGQLQILNLAWVGFSSTSLRLVVSHLPSSIRHLNLSGNRNTLIDEDLQILAQKCPDLEVLDVSDSHLLTVDSVALLNEGFSQLRHLSISRCYGLQPPSILLPLAGHSQLARLDVFGIMSGQALVQFSRHFRSGVEMNQCYFSYVARPTPWDPPAMRGSRSPDLTQIWGVRTNDHSRKNSP